MFLIFHGTWKKKTEMVSPEMICHRVVMVNHEELDSENTTRKLLGKYIT